MCFSQQVGDANAPMTALRACPAGLPDCRPRQQHAAVCVKRNSLIAASANVDAVHLPSDGEFDGAKAFSNALSNCVPG